MPPANWYIIVPIVFADCSIVTELREKKALCRDLCVSLILFLVGNFLSERNFLRLFFLQTNSETVYDNFARGVKNYYYYSHFKCRDNFCVIDSLFH